MKKDNYWCLTQLWKFGKRAGSRREAAGCGNVECRVKNQFEACRLRFEVKEVMGLGPTSLLFLGEASQKETNWDTDTTPQEPH